MSARNSLGQFIKGIPHNKGIKRSAEYKEWKSRSQIGKVLSEETKKKMSETHKKLGSGKRLMRGRGDKCVNWRGGLTSLSMTIRNSLKYHQWRSDIYQRDNYSCVLCGLKNGGGSHVSLEADHIKPFGLILRENKIVNIYEAFNCEELWNINNGRTLCLKCHGQTDTYGGRGNRFQHYTIHNGSNQAITQL